MLCMLELSADAALGVGNNKLNTEARHFWQNQFDSQVSAEKVNIIGLPDQRHS